MNTQPPMPPSGGSGNFGGPPQGGPGGFGYGQAPMGPVNNNMVMAILTTIFCCLPFGIVAIINASQVNNKLAMGDYHGAVQSAKQAKTWSMVSLGIGLGILVVYFFFGILAGLASSDY
jgi:hypothetical protein